MPKVKLPRKSTNIDMTAMCDVAFLLLSFFILATKTKPPEAVHVTNPSSVSTKVAAEEAVVITMNKEGKVFILLGDKNHQDKIINAINKNRQLGLTEGEVKNLKKMEFIGVPLSKLKSALDMDPPMQASQMEGIPTDSTNNEVVDWVRAVVESFSGEDTKKMNLLVKGDQQTKYPVFRSIIQALSKNDIYRFKIVTDPESPPAGSELALHPPKAEGEK